MRGNSYGSRRGDHGGGRPWGRGGRGGGTHRGNYDNQIGMIPTRVTESDHESDDEHIEESVEFDMDLEMPYIPNKRKKGESLSPPPTRKEKRKVISDSNHDRDTTDDSLVLSDSGKPKQKKKTRTNGQTRGIEANYLIGNPTNEPSNNVIDNKKIHLISNNEEFTLSKLNPIFFGRALDTVAGKIQELTRLKSGAVFITCKDSEQANEFLKLQVLRYKNETDIPVTAKIALANQTVKGKIYAPALVDMTTDEMVEELKDQKVHDVQKMYLNAEKNESHIYIITFYGNALPKKVKLGYELFEVDTYFPNTMKCFNCFRYGHTKKLCRNNPVCGNCTAKTHQTEDCRNLEQKCNNCKGNHKSFDKVCPIYKKETEICAVKTLQNVSFPEARKIVEQNSNEDNNRTQTWYPSQNNNVNNQRNYEANYPQLRTPNTQTNRQSQTQSSPTKPQQMSRNNNRSTQYSNDTITSDSPNHSQSLPALSPAVETSQRSQWFRPQKVDQQRRPNHPTPGHSNNGPSELTQLLESSQTENYITRESHNSMIQNPQNTQKDTITTLKEIILPVLPQIITLFVAKELSQKIEAILKIGETLKLGDIIGDTLVALGISSNATSQN